MATVLPVLSFAVGVFGQIKQAKDQKRASQEADRARRVNQVIAERANARKKLQTIREARIKNASIIAGGANQGVLNSSGVQGGAGSVTAQAGSNIANINELTGLSLRRNMFVSASYNAQSDANRIGAISNTLGSVLSVGSNISNQYASFKNNPTNVFATNNPSYTSAVGGKQPSFVPSFQNVFGQ